MDLIIRNEHENEHRAVEELTREAFWNVHVPGCAEHFCLHNMRGHEDFIPELDFVAEVNGKLAANIVYSRARIVSDDGETHEVISFGPVSVLPEYQRQGIGSSLIKYSLDKARSMGFTAVCIYGDPRYYGRLGFRCAEKYDIQNSQGQFTVALMTFELIPGAFGEISGRFIESEAFAVDEQAFEIYENSFPAKEKTVTESQADFKMMISLVY